MRLLLDVPLEGGCIVQNMPCTVVASCGQVKLVRWKQPGWGRGDVVAFGILPGLRNVRYCHDPDEVPRVHREEAARLMLIDAQARIPRTDLRVVARRELEELV